MKVYVDSENKIRAVGATTDTSLTEVFIDESADTFPFKGWSAAKICCYRVSVSDGVVTMMTPYIDSTLLDHIDQLGKQNDDLKIENAEQATEIEGLGDAIIEMSEIIYS